MYARGKSNWDKDKRNSMLQKNSKKIAHTWQDAATQRPPLTFLRPCQVKRPDERQQNY